MKLININENDILELDEFININKNEIDSGIISEDTASQACAIIISEYNNMIKYYEGKIFSIFNDIICIKYKYDKNEYIDDYNIQDLLSNIILLKNDSRFDFYDMSKAYLIAYDKCIKYLNCTIDNNDFNKENLTNIEYYINMIKECFKIRKVSDNTKEFINNNIWRIF